jgi:hypothetical protein
VIINNVTAPVWFVRTGAEFFQPAYGDGVSGSFSVGDLYDIVNPRFLFLRSHYSSSLAKLTSDLTHKKRQIRDFT